MKKNLVVLIKLSAGKVIIQQLIKEAVQVHF